MVETRIIATLGASGEDKRVRLSCLHCKTGFENEDESGIVCIDYNSIEK